MTATVPTLPTIEHTVALDSKLLIELLAAHSPLPQDPYGREPRIADIIQHNERIEGVLVFGDLHSGAHRIISEAHLAFLNDPTAA